MAAAATRNELRRAVDDLRRRGLFSASRWASEQLQGLPLEPEQSTLQVALDSDVVLLARSYFDMQEYRRAAHLLGNSDAPGTAEPIAVFVRLYSLYMAGEKQREEEIAQISGSEGILSRPDVPNKELKHIYGELFPLHQQGRLDGFLTYLLGLTMKGLDMKPEMSQMMCDAVNTYPLNWSAWQVRRSFTWASRLRRCAAALRTSAPAALPCAGADGRLP